MSKYDEQLDRMNYLMEFRNEPKKAVSNIEYHANGADGKVYGILREGTKYYIKTTEPGKENIAEAYDYINGFVNRRENEYKSYNDATKHLELKLMSLNEAYGKKGNVSTVDFNRSEKTFANLTEEARKELDRMHQIFENSCNIGPNCVCDPESKGKSTAEQTEKNNKPFDDKVTADMDFGGSKGTVKGSTDNSEVKGVDEDLQSDKMKKNNSNLDDAGNDKNNDDAHDDLDGEGVADKKLKGKSVKMNEDILEIGGDGEMEDNIPSLEFSEEEPIEGDEDIPMDEPEEIPTAEPEEVPAAEPEEVPSEDDSLVGDDVDIDKLLEEFLNEEDAITGPNAVLDKENNPINGTNNGVNDETSEDWKRIEEEAEYGETDKSEEPETMDNYKFGFNREKKLPAQSWDKMNVNENFVSNLVESIYQKLTTPKKQLTLEGLINKIVKEEVTKLDAWGKHPRYQKQPMTTPANKEVFAGTADRDWNDDSAKGEQPYGKKIGDGKPFDQKVVDLLTDQVLAKIKGMNQ